MSDSALWVLADSPAVAMGSRLCSVRELPGRRMGPSLGNLEEGPATPLPEPGAAEQVQQLLANAELRLGT